MKAVTHILLPRLQRRMEVRAEAEPPRAIDDLRIHKDSTHGQLDSQHLSLIESCSGQITPFCFRTMKILQLQLCYALILQGLLDPNGTTRD